MENLFCKKGSVAIFLVVIIMLIALVGMFSLFLFNDQSLKNQRTSSGGDLSLGEQKSFVESSSDNSGEFEGEGLDDNLGAGDDSFEELSYEQDEDDFEEQEDYEPIDCENDLQCFVEAAQQCVISEVTDIYEFELFGIEEIAITYYELLGDSDDCGIYMRIESIDIRFSEGLRQMMLDAGVPEEEIEQAEQESNEMADELEGRDGTCVFGRDDLVSAITSILIDRDVIYHVSCHLGMDDGSCETSNPWEDLGGQCEGTIFDSEL
ncbi:MAG: hypothetical protein ABIH92_03385 [Nanoarchaeota archaeon]